MKAERRHELQHNELADWLAHSIERVKPYSRAITGVAVLAAVVLLAYVVLSSRADKKRLAAWDEYYLAFQAPSREGIEADLQAVARDHKDLAGGLWAEVALADMKLGEGVAAYFTDKAAAEKKLKQSIEHYEAILPEADDPLLLARVRFGLARALESTGRLKEARAMYEEIANTSDTSAYASVAKARLDDLKRDSTQEFYAWFAQQQPVVVPEALLPGTPGQRPPFDSSTFGSPGDFDSSSKSILDFPSLGKGTTGPLLTPDDKGAAPETQKDAGGDTKDKEADAVDAKAKEKEESSSENTKSGGNDKSPTDEGAKADASLEKKDD